MSDPAMNLGEAELQKIGRYVKDHLRQWLSEVAPEPVTNTHLLERVVRVEEELKAQREIFLTRFEAVDRRFEGVDKRFDEFDKRFTILMWMIGLLTTVVVAGLGLAVA